MAGGAITRDQMLRFSCPAIDLRGNIADAGKGQGAAIPVDTRNSNGRAARTAERLVYARSSNSFGARSAMRVKHRTASVRPPWLPCRDPVHPATKTMVCPVPNVRDTPGVAANFLTRLRQIDGAHSASLRTLGYRRHAGRNRSSAPPVRFPWPVRIEIRLHGQANDSAESLPADQAVL